MAPHSSTLAWKIPRMEEPRRLQSMWSPRVGHDWVTSLSLFTFVHWRRKWQPTPVFLPGESQGWGEPGGLLSMGSHGVGHNWSDLAAVYYSSLFFSFCRSLVNVSCIFSIAFPRSWIIFTTIILNSYSGMLPISISFSCFSGILSFSFIWDIILSFHFD